MLIILLRGSVNDKARYLFTWYNISGSGLMTELEHIMFIQRVGRVLSKMKVLGAADMNIDDIKHMAFEARARKPQGEGSLPSFQVSLCATSSYGSTIARRRG